jgi:RNA polymerase sigma-70 factor (sigma-E family)
MTFDKWAEQDLPPLLRFATVLCGGRHLAEEVVQDVLVKAHSRWDRIEGADNPNAYLRRMVVNEFLSWRRKWARIVPRAQVDPEQVAAPDHASRHADADELLTELRRLPGRQRAVLVMRYYGGLSDTEIATILGCTPGTVRGYASRALSALRVEMRTETGSAQPEPSAAMDNGAPRAY